MKKEFIRDKNKILVLILRKGDFPGGLNFYTKEKDFIQLATWNYDKGKKTVPHIHKKVKRVADLTQEVIYIEKGEIRAEIYTDKGKLSKRTILKSGDLAIIFAGGHSFEILKDKTKVLEIKNGPYLGLKKDKKVINI